MYDIQNDIFFYIFKTRRYIPEFLLCLTIRKEKQYQSIYVDQPEPEV